jgi:hypothetical protein
MNTVSLVKSWSKSRIGADMVANRKCKFAPNSRKRGEREVNWKVHVFKKEQGTVS